jgi:FkbM family methyltransferase
MSVSCYLAGRLGNIFFHITTMIAYAKKHGLTYYVPEEAPAYKNKVNPLKVKSIGNAPIKPVIYTEPNMSSGNPAYHEIPFYENVIFEGYYQTFKYIDWCRDYILETLNIPYKFEKGMVSIAVRRGDCVGSTAFPIAPPEYYHKSVEYMQERGYNNFRVYSDDYKWCKNEFTSENYPNATFEFSEGDEMTDWISMSGCEHNITARSTFSLSAAWLNKNPNKIVLVPQKHIWWRGQNDDLIPDYFTEINFKEGDDSELAPYEMTYDNFSFILMIPDYWIKIYRGQKKEPLYHDYCLMLEKLKHANKYKYVLDIGMNHGLFAVPASKLGYKVFGFEPVAKNIRTLTLARDINELKDFHIYKFALSNRDGEIDIYVPDCPDNASLSKDAAISNMVSSKNYSVERVDTIRFDDWIVDHPAYKEIGFIKIDVQGAEYMVFDGMRNYLTSNNDIWIICEYEHHLNTMGYTFEQLDNLLYSYGFQFKGQLSPTDKIFYKP